MPIRSNRPLPISTATLIINRGIHDNKPLVMSVVAGTVSTLPVATGSGARYKFLVGTASNANVVSAPGSTFTGGYVQDDSGDSAVAGSTFMGPAAADNTYSPTTAGGGGLAGDWVEFTDYAVGKYMVFGANQAVADASNRFSTV